MPQVLHFIILFLCIICIPIFGLFYYLWQPHIQKSLTELDNKVKKNGYYTKSDIMELSMKTWVKKFWIFSIKRSGEITFYYQLPNDEMKYESIYDIAKHQRNVAETYFIPTPSEPIWKWWSKKES